MVVLSIGCVVGLSVSALTVAKLLYHRVVVQEGAGYTLDHFQVDAEKKDEGHSEELDPVGQFGFYTIDLGAFEVPLVSETPGQFGVKNIASIHLVLACHQQAVCQWIESHQQHMKNAVVRILNPLQRDDLMSFEGKKRLKFYLLSVLNRTLYQLLPKQLREKNDEKNATDFLKDIFFKQLLIV